MKIVKETKNKLHIQIESNYSDENFMKEIDQACDIAKKKLENYSYEWANNNILIFKKAKLQKCELCGSEEVLNFEFENGKETKKICALCWIKINS